MNTDLGSILPEIEASAKEKGLVLFHGKSRLGSDFSFVEWDTERRSDFREFLDAAVSCGVKMVCVHGHLFTNEEFDYTISMLKDLDLPTGERRSLEKQLKPYEMYVGFTSSVELSFDHADNTYFFHLRTPWRVEYVKLASSIDNQLMDDLDDDDEPMSGGGGFFSRN